MPEERYFVLDQIEGTRVGVLHKFSDQEILIQNTYLGERLTRLLKPQGARTVQRGQDVFWRMHHSRQVDALLVELIDLFITIRYAHPTLVQLELALPAPSGVRGHDSEGIGPGPAAP